MWSDIKEANFTEINLARSIQDNSILILDLDGKIKRKISFAEMMVKNETILSYVSMEKSQDPFHSNTLNIIDRDVVYENGLKFKKGNVLFCIGSLLGKSK